MSSLLIVESPAKSKTITKYLGNGFTVLASYGHVRDLPKKNGAIDVEHDFAPTYEIIERNKGHVEQIIRSASRADAIYLATDLDREGEAISWHILEILKEKGLLKNKTVHRVTFSEITKKAIQEAVAHPRDLSMDMVNAQQARRTLDYLVGFTLSPVLWRKVHAGLSAGRVQSPALRMIVEREEEIEKFDPKEYWTIEAALKAKSEFTAKLVQYEGKKFEQFDIVDEQRAREAVERLKRAANGNLTVGTVKKSERQRKPYPPFTTSTLQMDAAHQLGFATSKTMRIAQGLYEGIDLGGGERVGLITYMRTDAVNLSDDAIAEIREYIGKNFDDVPTFGRGDGHNAGDVAKGVKGNYLPSQPNRYHSKSKNAQEAHEAIRPSSVNRTPAAMAKYLDKDQLKLYELIWKRTVACQMSNAVLSTVSVVFPLPDCEGGAAAFRANGSTVVFPGFLAVYEEGKDAKKGDDDDKRLPVLAEGDVIKVNEIVPSQHFTEPPPRFSEATLVRTLEEHDIGRPSTYATIIQVLLNREYVELKDKRFHPTDIGRSVANFLSKHFTQYVDYEFTANLEGELDAIANGQKAWLALMREFWQPFKQLVDEKNQTVDRDEAQGARILGTDPETGKPVSARLGRFGPIIQIGSKSDAEKPKFASLPEGKSIQSITFEEAMALFNEKSALPRILGKGPTGEDVLANKGRFGPFVQMGKIYANLKEHDPLTISLEEAIAILNARQEFLANRYILDFGDGLQVMNGNYGPFVTDTQKRASVPKDRDPKTLTADEARDLLKEHGKPFKKGKGGKPFNKNGKPKFNKMKGKSGPRPSGAVDDLPM